MSIVRANLMERKGYTPYCGHAHCKYHWPRTRWSSSKEQFVRTCGWVSQFEPEFIQKYKRKWNKP